MADNFFVRCCNGGAHPVCRFKVVAEFVGIAVFAVFSLSCDILPKVPGFADAVANIRNIGCMGLVAVAGSVRATAVCYEYKIVFDKVNGLLFAVFYINYLFCNFFVAVVFDYNILDVHTVFNGDAVRFKILYKGKYHAFVLIVFCESQCAEIGKTVDVVNVSAKVSLHFKCARPTLERKHRLPIKPEVC